MVECKYSEKELIIEINNMLIFSMIPQFIDSGGSEEV